MKKYLTTLLVLLLSAGLVRAATPAVAPLAVAVLEVEPATPALKDRSTQIGALLLAGLSNAPGVILVERAQLDTALGELSLAASGLANSATAAKVGQLTGAKVFVTARAIGAGSDTTVIAKVLGTETGRVFAVTKVFTAGDNLTTATNDLAEKIAQTISAHATELVAPVEDAAARGTRLRALVAGKTLPAVTITIPEQHLTRPVQDPAAETEIARTLGGLGFTLFDQAAAPKAAIRITGEAISELAIRRGDFVSCRARVEVKVVDVATGKILLQDRQSEVVADISEALAAKTALARAGAKLAERIVGALAPAKP